MDSGGGGGGGGNKYRYHRKPPYSDRLLTVFSTTHSLSQPSTSASASNSTAAGDELSEHDIFDTSADPADVSSADAVHHSMSSSSNPNPNNHHHHHRNKHFGILAALPESESHGPASATTLLSVSSSSSSSSASSARLIPTIPKRPPPVDRVKYLQSAPVNVPIVSPTGRRNRYFDDNDDYDDDVDGGEMMLPPHELVASRQTPILASSVVEGAGRKLKGRDLRQVRNAIWRQTGFLD